MELLTPSPPTPANFPSGFSSMASFRRGFYRTSQIVNPQSREVVQEEEEQGSKVYVAVGKSVDKGAALVQWACKTFGNSEICILHVLEPSPYVPTLCMSLFFPLVLYS